MDDGAEALARLDFVESAIVGLSHELWFSYYDERMIASSCVGDDAGAMAAFAELTTGAAAAPERKAIVDANRDRLAANVRLLGHELISESR
jgi:hypothetical protein